MSASVMRLVPLPRDWKKPVKVAARQLPVQAFTGSRKLSIGRPSPMRHADTEPTEALMRVPVPAPFQDALATMALRMRVRPRSPSAMLGMPRLSTIRVGGLSQVRRGLSRAYENTLLATRQARTVRVATFD